MTEPLHLYELTGGLAATKGGVRGGDNTDLSFKSLLISENGRGLGTTNAFTLGFNRVCEWLL